jgi:ubiquinone biosynthesis protein
MTGTLQELPKVGRILRVLVRHGFVGALRHRREWPEPARVREAFEELGVIFLKFGQMLALRRDLLPSEYAQELERLHDDVSPLPIKTVRATVQQSLGAPLRTLFASFDPEPLASATIAQVHAASLHDGRRVVVKVRRAGLEERVAEDSDTLAWLAAKVEALEPRARALDLVGMVEEFRETLTREMDLQLEGVTIRRFRAALAGEDSVWIPDVVDERTSDAVLTLEHSPGERIDRYAEQYPEERAELARRLAALVLHQILETGLFQADPHPGNVFVLPDGRICLLDFGMTGELDERTRDQLVSLLEAMVRSDARAVTHSYLELGLLAGDVDQAALEQDVIALLTKVRERPLAEVSVGDVLESLLRAGSQHNVRNPRHLLLLGRALLVAESVMRSLDPELNVIEVFRSQVERVALKRHAPARMLRDSRHLARELERMAQEVPADLRRTLRRLADGELGRLRAPAIEELGMRTNRDIRRLTQGVTSAALVVGGALLTTTPGIHRAAGDVLLILGLLGTLGVSAGALWRKSEDSTH